MAHEEFWRLDKPARLPEFRDPVITDELRSQVLGQVTMMQEQYESRVVEEQTSAWAGIMSRLQMLAPKRLSINTFTDVAHPIWELQQGPTWIEPQAVTVVGRIALQKESNRVTVEKTDAHWHDVGVRGYLATAVEGAHVISPDNTVRNIIADNILIREGRDTLTEIVEHGTGLNTLCRQIIAANATNADTSAQYLKERFIANGEAQLADLYASRELLGALDIQQMDQPNNPHEPLIQDIIR
ncbi:MAG TPA: hypothetical protein VLG11_05385 [Candidatus Saccharimonadales bacterium]|nr:hypothetical protein [Candidatus Saccharimonadales bacterium]